MKRTLSLVLAALLALTLTACGQTAQTPATPGENLYQVFLDLHGENPDADVLTLAEELLSHESIPFAGAAVQVEPGLLAGFGNTEITGFQSAATFGPMIGTIPFIGYLFQLDDPGAGAEFCQVLESAADPQWNICTQADETIVRQDGDLVFFLMCPLDWEG